MEYIPTEDFPNFENISLPGNEMLWLSTKYEYFPTSSRKSEDFPKILGVADMKLDMVADLEVDMVEPNRTCSEKVTLMLNYFWANIVLLCQERLWWWGRSGSRHPDTVHLTSWTRMQSAADNLPDSRYKTHRRLICRTVCWISTSIFWTCSYLTLCNAFVFSYSENTFHWLFSLGQTQKEKSMSYPHQYNVLSTHLYNVQTY